MYQALYRKWRPRTFDDVVGQSHITDTLKQQVAGGRLSHAYLFTGTRGTGKTTCAKILSRAVNCQSPVNGNPCNQCPACLGIENGSILDVLELDAASNNGVDQVRALRDEAVYTPAAVRKRVYIVDEVHMLSTPAFNALLKILEEPPSHLMFILATTELHKVPATIRSRCQQFAFKRILPGQIAQRLEYVAGQEGIDLTPEGAALLARLADGGLRDALSLLDQCSGGGQQVDEQAVLDTLGLAGNLETARLMELAARHDTAAALETLSRLYAGGKDVGAVLGELSSLARDLLMRKTAPRGGSALLTGGYDETTMRGLGELLTAPRLLQMLNRLQDTAALLPRSELEGEMGESSVGVIARLMSQALRKLAGTVSRTNCIVVFINQLREKIGVMYGNPETTPGGRALKYFSSVRIDVRRIETLKVGGEMIGNRTRAKIVKNKVAPPFKEAEFDIIYGEGISKIGEIVDLGVKLDLIDKAGAWYTYGDVRVQGRDSMKEYLREHPDVSDKIEAEIRANAHKLMSPQARKAAIASGRAVEVAADDFQG